MSRFKKVVRNMILLAILFLLFLMRSGLYLSPLSAHQHSERSIHYGPSEVVYIEDFDKGKYILGKYEKWVSCNTVKRELFFFWGFGSQVTGFENDQTQHIDYTWSASHQYYKLYGIINDDKIKKVEITFENGRVFTQTDFYDDLFLFAWESNNDKGWDFKTIKGYDLDNNVIFEDDITG